MEGLDVARIELNGVKKVFDKFVAKLYCHYCRIVPRTIPIYQYTNFGGMIVCSKCHRKESRPQCQGLERSLLLEDLLLNLPTYCRYLKNGCEEFSDKESVIRHEDVCEVRDVFCPYQSQTFGNCKHWVPFNKLSDHMKELHNFDVTVSSSCVTSKARLSSDKPIVSSSSSSKISSLVHDYLIRNSFMEVANEFNERMGPFEENDGTKLEDIYIHYLNYCNSPNRRNPKVSYFDVKVVMPRVSFEEYDYRYFIGPIRYGSNAFILHIRNYKEQTMLWLQLFDSRKEAKKFTYIVQINDPVLGEWRYKGLVKSLDDRRDDVHDSKQGLVMPFEITEKLVRNYHLPIEIGIENCNDNDEESIEYCNTTEEATEYCNTTEESTEWPNWPTTRKDSNLMEVDDDVSDGESPSPPPNTRIVRILSTPDLESREGEAEEEGSGDHQETREGGDSTLESREGLAQVPGSSIWETLRSIIKTTNHPNV